MKFLLGACVSAVLASLLVACGKAPTPGEIEGDQLLERTREDLRNGLSRDGRAALIRLLDLETRNGRQARLGEIAELLAESYQSGAQFDSAFHYLDQSYEYFRAVADKYAARRVRLSAADLYRQMGDEEHALAVVSEMSRISEVLGDIQGVTEFNWALIPIYRSLGRRGDEDQALTTLLNTASAAKSTAMQARVYAEWADAFMYRGDGQAATENCIRALGLASRSGDPRLEVFVRSKLAAVYAGTGAREEAFRTFTDALLQSDSTAGSETLREGMLVRVGNIYLEDSDFLQADRFYEAALRSAMGRDDKLIEGYLYLQRGHCAVGLKPRSAESLGDYQVALDLFTSYAYDPGIAYAHASFAMAAMKNGQLADALGHLSTAVSLQPNPGTIPGTVDLTSECEEAFYRLQGTNLHEAYLEVLLLLGKYEEAFLYHDGLQASEIAAALRAFTLETGRQQTTAAVWQVKHSSDLKMSTLRQERAFLASGATDPFLFRELRESNAEYGRSEKRAEAQLEVVGSPGLESLVSARAHSVQEVQGMLPENSALLTYMPTRRSVFLFSIRKNNWNVQLAAVAGTQLESLEQSFEALLGDHPDETEEEALQNRRLLISLSASLYGILIRPVAGTFGGVDRLLVVPYDRVIPVHALRPAGRTTKFLIEDLAVSYLPSASALSLQDSTMAPGSIDIVGVGHPGSTAWDAEYELRDIQAFYKPARLYFGIDAGMGTLRREHATILHLAAEFGYDGKRPGNSFVRLSDGKTAAGIATVQWGSFFSLPPFKTVIVSDLSVHQGIPPVEPLLFLANGSSSVVLTTASAHRKTKKYFGELFYTAVVGGESGAGAYRAAMKGMIVNEEYSSPAVWAPFCLWGY